MEYGTGRVFGEPYEQVVGRVRDALKAEGFGVITEIDVQKTMKEKLGVDGPSHVILGACNPPLAHRAISLEPDIGVLLPCNVDVYETGGGTRVVAVNIQAVLGMVGNQELAEVAAEVQERLSRAMASL